MFKPKVAVGASLVEKISELRVKFLPTTLVLSLSLILVSCGFPQAKQDNSNKITIMGVGVENAEEELREALAPFTEKTGIVVEYEGTSEFATLLPVRVASGNPPDIALFPQPGLMADLAREGDLVPIETFLEKSQLTQAYPQEWLDLSTIDGKIYGIWIKTFLKSLVWYNPQAFEAAGYQIPTTWQEMTDLSDKIVAEGSVPWCLGIENSSATGWVGTDWIEDIMLRTVEPKVYDQWVEGKITFEDPVVKNAFTEFGKIALNPQYVAGGTTGIISIPFGDSPNPLFENPPGCYLHRQATFITSFFPENVVVGKDVDVFPLPSIKEELGVPLLVGGEIVAVFNDTPEVQALVEYLTTAKPHEIFVSKGGYISPHQQINLDAYPDEVTKRQAEILAKAEVVRFDGSDMMPGAVGTGTFWTGIVDYVGGTDVDTVLQNIQEGWPEE
ncbi:MAG: carbohydrate ABC transporter substrate-binding protein [Symploca sp. SIO1C2]|nr:carbohydrate ABC transporter substrate-binding protein [Symploca sp. SIO1C2]